MTDKPDRTVAIIPKNNRGDELRLLLRTFKGATFFDLRLFIEGSDGDRIPTKTGCSVKPELLDAVIAAFKDARQIASAEGLING